MRRHDEALAYIGLGANLGDARATVEQALAALAAFPETMLRRVSALYSSEPVDAAGPPYVNAVALLQTRLAPFALMKRLRALERRHQRRRPYRNAPRTLDLDLLLYGGMSLQTPELMLPHPRMHERGFVLQPLAEIDPHATVPGRGVVADLLAQPAVAAQRLWKLVP